VDLSRLSTASGLIHCHGAVTVYGPMCFKTGKQVKHYTGSKELLTVDLST
jgi:hypothetical protein